MRRSDYPQYFGSGVGHFLYWCSVINEWMPKGRYSKRQRRVQLRYWLDIDTLC